MNRFIHLVSLAALIAGVSVYPVQATQALAASPESAAQADCGAAAAETAAARSQADGARRRAAFGFVKSLVGAASPSLLGQVGGGSMLGHVAAQAAAGMAQQAAMQQVVDRSTGSMDAAVGRLTPTSPAGGCTDG